MQTYRRHPRNTRQRGDSWSGAIETAAVIGLFVLLGSLYYAALSL